MFLFSVSKKASKSYLLGTYHYLEFDKLPEWLRAFIDHAKVVQLESYIPKGSTSGVRSSHNLLRYDASEDQANLYDFAKNTKIRAAVLEYISTRKLKVSIDDLTDKGVFILYLETFGIKKAWIQQLKDMQKRVIKQY